MKKIILIIVYSVFMRLFLKLTLGIKFHNREVLKKEGQFILVANHNSHLDAVTLMSAVPSSLIHKVHPVAASDYFGNSKAKTFLSKIFVNALLIPRSRSEEGPDPIELMAESLRAGESLILFPEGSRGKPEVMQRFRRGIGILLQQFPEITVIPVYLEGLGKSLPKGDTVLVPFNSVACFGGAVKINFGSPEEIAEELERAIHQLKDKTIIKEDIPSGNSETLTQERAAFVNAVHFMEHVKST